MATDTGQIGESGNTIPVVISSISTSKSINKLIPADTFAVEPRGDPHGMRWGSQTSRELILRATADALEISLIQLGKLIGMPFPHLIYRWNSKRRVGQIYAAGMSYLLILAIRGERIYGIKSIDWTPGRIEWLDNFGPRGTKEEL